MTDPFREVWSPLERAWSGDVLLDNFESWVYASPDLEGALGPDHALALLAFDYRQTKPQHELRKLIESIYDNHRPGGLPRDTARRAVEAYLAGRTPLWAAASELSRLRAGGNEDWIPDVFMYINSELEVVPDPAQYPLWNPEALARKVKELEPLVQAFEREAWEAAGELLRYLEKWRPR